MKFRTQVELNNEVHTPSAALSEDEFMYVYPRLGIRGCSIQVMDMFIETIKGYISETSLAANSNIDAMYSTYADGHEAFFKINGEEMEGNDAFAGDFFEMLPEVVIIIHGSNSPLRSLQPGQSDAIYSHDFQDAYEAGEIDVTIAFPKNPEDIPSFLNEKRPELIGLLAHEMQHAVQKLVYGARLSEHAVQGLQSHIDDIYEIDSRVEEVIARLPEYIHEDNETKFLSELKIYIEQYLDRNASSVENIQEIKDNMIDSHLNHYRRKLGKENVL